jgi:integrase
VHRGVTVNAWPRVGLDLPQCCVAFEPPAVGGGDLADVRGLAHLRSYPAGPDDLVFRSSEGEPTRLSNWRRRTWEPAVTAAKLDHLRPHDLRHTAVALWIAAGASPKEIAARAGHSSVVTVLDRYGHLFPGSDDKVNDALDAMAVGASEDTATITAI